MEKNDILQQIIEILAPAARLSGTEMKVERVEDLRIEDLGMDSLDILQFGVDLDEKLGIDVDVDDLPANATLSELAEFLAQVRQ